jgi:SM-20-related protein
MNHAPREPGIAASPGDRFDRVSGRFFYVCPHFLDADVCVRLREEMEAASSEPAAVLPSGAAADGGRHAWYVDVSHRTLREVERYLDDVGPVVAAFFGCRLGEREGTGFLRYDTGGFYGPHRDRGDNADWPDAARRRVSTVVFLNSGGEAARPGHFAGGTLRLFLDDTTPVDIVPVAGTLVAFRADTLHEVTPVTSGVRYALVDWYYDAVTTVPVPGA